MRLGSKALLKLNSSAKTWARVANKKHWDINQQLKHYYLLAVSNALWYVFKLCSIYPNSQWPKCSLIDVRLHSKTRCWECYAWLSVKQNAKIFLFSQGPCFMSETHRLTQSSNGPRGEYSACVSLCPRHTCSVNNVSHFVLALCRVCLAHQGFRSRGGQALSLGLLLLIRVGFPW